MSVYIKIFIGSVIWAIIIWNIGDVMFEKEREQACSREVRKHNVNQSILEDSCIKTAEKYMNEGNYGTASWFYLLGRDIDKNINEVEAKIDNDFYMNIGHSYVLKGEMKKAEKIYDDFLFSNQYSLNRLEEVLEDDYTKMRNVYPENRVELDRGWELWSRLYAPIGKIVEFSAKAEEADDEGNYTKKIEALNQLVKYSEPYRDKKVIKYGKRLDELAEAYYDDSQYENAIGYYEKAGVIYRENNQSYQYADILYWSAKSYNYLKRYHRAVEYYEESIPLYIESEGNSSSSLDFVYDNLGKVYEELYDIDKNRTALKRAFVMYSNSIKYQERYQSDEYSDLADTYSRMGKLKFKTAEYESAKTLQKRVIELKRKYFDDSEYDKDDKIYELESFSEEYLNLSNTLYKMGDLDEAISNYKEYIAFVKEKFPENLEEYATAEQSMATFFADKDVSLSLSYYKKSIETLKEYVIKSEGSYFYRLLTYYDGYAELLLNESKADEVKPLLEEFLAYTKKSFPENEEYIEEVNKKIAFYNSKIKSQ